MLKTNKVWPLKYQTSKRSRAVWGRVLPRKKIAFYLRQLVPNLILSGFVIPQIYTRLSEISIVTCFCSQAIMGVQMRTRQGLSADYSVPLSCGEFGCLQQYKCLQDSLRPIWRPLAETCCCCSQHADNTVSSQSFKVGNSFLMTDTSRRITL